jgi:hypothetical protein
MRFAKKTSKTYQLFNNYCLRTPLFLIQFYKKTWNYFKKRAKINPVFREAIFLASPELYPQIIRWEKGNFSFKMIRNLTF